MYLVDENNSEWQSQSDNMLDLPSCTYGPVEADQQWKISIK